MIILFLYVLCTSVRKYKHLLESICIAKMLFWFDMYLPPCRERPLSRAESLNVQQPEVDISHNIQHIVICEDVPVRAMESIIIFLYSHCGTITGVYI